MVRGKCLVHRVRWDFTNQVWWFSKTASLNLIIGEKRSSSSPSATFYPEVKILILRERMRKGHSTLRKGNSVQHKKTDCAEELQVQMQERIFYKCEAGYEIWKISAGQTHIKKNSNMFHVHPIAQTAQISSKPVETSSFKIPRATIPNNDSPLSWLTECLWRRLTPEPVWPSPVCPPSAHSPPRWTVPCVSSGFEPSPCHQCYERSERRKLRIKYAFIKAGL